MWWWSGDIQLVTSNFCVSLGQNCTESNLTNYPCWFWINVTVVLFRTFMGNPDFSITISIRQASNWIKHNIVCSLMSKITCSKTFKGCPVSSVKAHVDGLSVTTQLRVLSVPWVLGPPCAVLTAQCLSCHNPRVTRVTRSHDSNESLCLHHTFMTQAIIASKYRAEINNG